MFGAIKRKESSKSTPLLAANDDLVLTAILAGEMGNVTSESYVALMHKKFVNETMPSTYLGVPAKFYCKWSSNAPVSSMVGMMLAAERNCRLHLNPKQTEMVNRCTIL